jgi:hypothetical protein
METDRFKGKIFFSPKLPYTFCHSKLYEATKIDKNIVRLPRDRLGASRQRNIFHIVPLDPAHTAGLVGHIPLNFTSCYVNERPNPCG